MHSSYILIQWQVPVECSLKERNVSAVNCILYLFTKAHDESHEAESQQFHQPEAFAKFLKSYMQ